MLRSQLINAVLKLIEAGFTVTTNGTHVRVTDKDGVDSDLRITDSALIGTFKGVNEVFNKEFNIVTGIDELITYLK